MSEYIWCLALHMLDYDLIAVIPMKNTHKQIKQNIATTTKTTTITIEIVILQFIVIPTPLFILYKNSIMNKIIIARTKMSSMNFIPDFLFE